MENRTTLDRIHGMFGGVAFGDACGMSVETMERPEIMQLSDGQGVTEYMDPQTNRVWMRDMKAGSTTDDWQLTSVVGHSLVESGGYDLENLARRHIEAMNANTFGWGAGTTNSLQEIKEGKRTPFEEPLWTTDGSGKGSGNGILMKISPFAALSALTGKDYTEEIMEFGRMTHPDVRARIAAIPLYLCLVEVLTGRFKPAFGSGAWYDQVAIPKVKEFEEKYMKTGDKHFLSAYMEKLDITDVDSLIASAGVSFVAWDTIAFTLGCYMRNPMDFDGAMFEAVNAGGDTDTNASIVCGLVGATIGYRAIPDKWKTISAVTEVEELTERFWNKFAHI